MSPSSAMTSFYTRPIVISGTGLNAEVITTFIEEAKMGDVAAFTIDGEYVDRQEYLGRPVVALEELPERFPAEQYCVVNCIGYNSMNDTRRRISNTLRQQGYELPGFIHPSALIDPSVQFGSNFIAVQGVIVEPFVSIGDDVTLWSGCYVGHHSVIDSGVYIGPRAVLPGTVKVGENVFIGANATIRSKISIGARCLIGAGAYVHQDVPAKAVLKAKAAVQSKQSSDDFTYFS